MRFFTGGWSLVCAALALAACTQQDQQRIEEGVRIVIVIVYVSAGLLTTGLGVGVEIAARKLRWSRSRPEAWATLGVGVLLVGLATAAGVIAFALHDEGERVWVVGYWSVLGLAALAMALRALHAVFRVLGSTR